MATATTAREGRERTNTWNLPRGENLRRGLVRWFRAMQAAYLRWARTGELPTKKDTIDLPDSMPLPDSMGMGADVMADSIGPLIESIWDAEVKEFASEIGLDAAEWAARYPNLAGALKDQVTDLCKTVEASTTAQLDAALAELKAQIDAGTMAGDTTAVLVGKIKGIFDSASTWKARMIAVTEASRSKHEVQVALGEESGIVTGWRWMTNGDPCPVCIMIEEECQFIEIGKPFAIIGDDPTYSTIMHPPAHPNCLCTIEAVLVTDDEQPEWGETLIQPTPERDAKVEVDAEDRAKVDERMAGMFGPGSSPDLAARLAGAIPGTTATVTPGTLPGSVVVDIKGDGITIKRMISTGPDGKPVVQNVIFELDEDKQGKGIGTRVLATQVEEARKAGVSRITLAAAGGADDAMVGYKVWPKLGFDGPLPPKILDMLPSGLAGSKLLSDLYATPAGVAWWEEHGSTIGLWFDLAPGSYSTEVWDEYLASKGG